MSFSVCQVLERTIQILNLTSHCGKVLNWLTILTKEYFQWRSISGTFELIILANNFSASNITSEIPDMSFSMHCCMRFSLYFFMPPFQCTSSCSRYGPFHALFHAPDMSLSMRFAILCKLSHKLGHMVIIANEISTHSHCDPCCY